MVISMNLPKIIEPEIPDPKTTHSRVAILWGREDLLAQAVSLLLESGKTWQVLRIPGGQDIERLIQKIKNVKPDVVILCQERLDDDISLPIRLIQGQLCQRVVIVELESNQIQVYSQQNIIVQGASDLLSIIESGIFPDRTPEKEVKRT
jgi:hypothetical protein